MRASVRCAWALIVLCACGSSAHGVTPEAQPQPSPPAPAAAPSRTSASAPAAQGARVVLLPPGADPVSVRVELARDEATRRRGLMFREHMDDDAGMLFLFDRSEQLTFWMHNTYIPLDMIFIEPSLRVLGVVENAEPQTDSSRAVPGASQYVLEVNAGFSRRHGLGKGTAVRFEGVPGFESENSH
jgi:uncharacterized membrane protein (UPF0127 family)